MTALPKPKKYDREPANVDTSKLRFAKRHFNRDAGYRKWVRGYPCALKGKGFGNCSTSKVEAAHTATGGLQIKHDDSRCAPLCGGPDGHHRKFDTYELPKEAREIVRRRAAEIRRRWEASR